MKCSGQNLLTPVYLKLEETMPWPDQEPVFYLLSRDGLFLCRNHPFFKSCVPTDQWPGELAGQSAFLRSHYPRLSRPLLERIVGFFSRIGKLHGSEAAVLLAWDSQEKKILPVVPQQIGRVTRSYNGRPFPIDLRYEIPPLAPNLRLIGDVHSHVDGPAYASSTDQADEVHYPGIHLVVGHLEEEPPQFHCELTTDGTRFRVRDLSLVLEGYRHRRPSEVPQDWMDKVTVQPWTAGETTRVLPAYDSAGPSLIGQVPLWVSPRDETEASPES